MRKIALIVAIAMAMGSLTAQATADYFPDQEWRTSTPEEQGMNSGILANMFKEIAQRHLDIHSVLVIRHGYKVLDANVAPFDDHTRHTLNSVTKSFVSALVGCALQDGLIKSLDQPALDYFPGVEAGADKRAITLRHFLTMSSGFDMDNGGYRTKAVYGSNDWARAYWGRSLAAEPGTLFNYDNPGVDVLARAVCRATGKDLASYASERLFKPLGISDYYWSKKPSGENDGYRGLVLSTDSLARFAYLYLHGGSWKGQQLLPADYVRDSLSSHISQSNMKGGDWLGYGYLWWEVPQGFAAEGWGGQIAIIYPAFDMVVVMTADLGAEYSQIPRDLATWNIVTSFRQNSPTLAGVLKKAVAEFEQSHSVPARTAPAWANIGPGRSYRFTSEKVGYQSVTVSGTAKETTVVLHNKSPDQSPQYKLPLDGAFHIIQPSFAAGESKYIARADWSAADTLVLEFYNQDVQECLNKLIFSFSEPDNCTMMVVPPPISRQIVTTWSATLESSGTAQ